jgi:hypothetical protein
MMHLKLRQHIEKLVALTDDELAFIEQHFNCQVCTRNQTSLKKNESSIPENGRMNAPTIRVQVNARISKSSTWTSPAIHKDVHVELSI